MLAVQLEDGRLEVREEPVPARKPGFALLRTLCAGICNTDLELQRGYYGFRGRPGHEFVGEVVEADNISLLGRRVVGEINLACGACEWCRRGLGRHCPNRTTLGIAGHPGAFAEYLTLPEENLFPLPDEIATEHGTFVEPVAASCEILDQVSFPPGAEVAVLGDGKLGLLTAQVLHASGLSVRLYGRHESKLAIARSAGICTATAPPPRAAFDWVVEASGSAAALQQAVQMTRPRGTIVMKSTVHDRVGVDFAAVIVNEIALLGSRCGRFAPAIELLRTGRVQVGGMISARYPLARAPEAFAEAARRGVLKVLLTC